VNLYSVISEELEHPGSYEPPEPPEPYCIVELVAATSPGAAKFAAWRKDRSFRGTGGDVLEMPRFSVCLVARDVDLPAGLHTRGLTPDMEQVWYAAMERQDGRPKPAEAHA